MKPYGALCWFFLSLFIYHQFRIESIFLTSANKQKIHICCNTKETIASEITFKLSSKINCMIVKKLDHSPVGKSVFKIDAFPCQNVQLFYFG